MWTRPKRKAPAKPSRRRVDELALRVLEEAALEARTTPVERTHGHRLALAWLTFTDTATPDQAKDFWDCLGHAEKYAGERGAFYRTCDPKIFLQSWRKRIG